MKNLLHVIEDSTAKICLSTPGTYTLVLFLFVHLQFNSEMMRMIKMGLLANKGLSLPENFTWLPINTKEIMKSTDPLPSLPIPTAETILMLQYSSGSTGRPKGLTFFPSVHLNVVEGVKLSHGN